MTSLHHIFSKLILWSSQAKLSNRIGGIGGQVLGAYIRLLPVCSDLYFVVFAFIALLWSLLCYRPFKGGVEKFDLLIGIGYDFCILPIRDGISISILRYKDSLQELFFNAKVNYYWSILKGKHFSCICFK